MVMNILAIKIPWGVSNHETGLSGWKCSIFSIFKFKDTVKTNFQCKLDADIKNKIKKPNSLFIPADKTTNYYAMNTTAYNKLIKENVTKTYKNQMTKLQIN